MKKQFDIDVLDQIQNKLHCGASLISILHEALASGDSGNDYVEALYAAYNYLESLSDEMEKILDAGRKETGAA